MYALEGYCSACAGNSEAGEDESESQQQTFLKEVKATARKRESESPIPTSLIGKNKGKFFKAVEPLDERHYQEASRSWERQKQNLPYPKQEVPVGEKTKSGLLAHHYRYWHQLFNERQLLCLSNLLTAVSCEEKPLLREKLLLTFSGCLETNNTFTRQRARRSTPGGTPPFGIFERHDFQPKSTFCEQNVWGTLSGINTFTNRMKLMLGAQTFRRDWWEYIERGGELDRVRPIDPLLRIEPNLVEIMVGDSRGLVPNASGTIAAVITDPPYGGNVNYAELSDFFYVWLRLLLSNSYPAFSPEYTPKQSEIIVNRVRGKTLTDFRHELARAFGASAESLSRGGTVVFTFHHREGETWQVLLEALCIAGLEITAVFPVHSENEETLNQRGTQAISYDLIHVCRKRESTGTREKRAWATIKGDIRREARKEIDRIEKGVYGSNKSLPSYDKLVVLTGKCLQLYSRHYNAVVDHTGRVVPLKEALQDIRMLVDQLVSQERPLPSELEDIDRPSYVYLTALSEKKEIKSDEVHKATRGIIEVDELLEAGLMKKGRAGRGRTFEVKTPSERFSSLLEKFKDELPVSQSRLFADQPSSPGNGSSLFIDRLHFLIGLAEGKENLRPWVERWGGEIPQIRAACEYLLERRKDFAPALKKILTMIDVGSLGFK
jgi:hypothetical protein